MNAHCTLSQRTVSALLLAACAWAVPASGDIILNSYRVMHRHIIESGPAGDTVWTSGDDHLTYGERWTPPPWQQNPLWTYTQTRSQDRFAQDPATGAIRGTLMTSAYWNTTEPAGCDLYLVAGVYLSMQVTVTTPGDYGVLWLVSGPGWPNSQAYLPWWGLSEVAWNVSPTSMVIDIGPPVAPLASGHMSAYLPAGDYELWFVNVLWPEPILAEPGARHVDQVVWFEFAAPSPGSVALLGAAAGVLGLRRRR